MKLSNPGSTFNPAIPGAIGGTTPAAITCTTFSEKGVGTLDPLNLGAPVTVTQVYNENGTGSTQHLELLLQRTSPKANVVRLQNLHNPHTGGGISDSVLTFMNYAGVSGSIPSAGAVGWHESPGTDPFNPLSTGGVFIESGAFDGSTAPPSIAFVQTGFISGVQQRKLRMMIDHSGNVRIGESTNTAAAATLQLYRENALTNFRITADTGQFSGIDFYRGSTQVANYFLNNSDNVMTLGTTTASNLQLRYNGSNVIVLTGTGASVTGILSVSSTTTLTGGITDATNIALGTGTGTKLGTATSQKLGFWNAAPVIQQTTGSAASTFVANTSAIANDSATFDGYTLGQVVKILRTLGILA